MGAPAALIPMNYVLAIERAGAPRPVLLPPSEDGVEETLDRLDGLLLAGGEDLDPETYGAEPHPATEGAPRRDRSELALLRGARAGPARARDLPRLADPERGVRRRSRPAPAGRRRPRRPQAHPGVFADHDVTVNSRSRLGRVLGDRAPVKSHHHQGFGRIGDGLRESAWAEDGTVEALELPRRASRSASSGARKARTRLSSPRSSRRRGAIAASAAAWRSERRRRPG